MATLALTTDEILKAMCLVAAVDRDPGELDEPTQQDFRLCIRNGLRAFFHPLDERGQAHTWRFLERPYVTAMQTAYSTGTVTVSGGTVTLASGTWPSWAADGVLNVDGQRVFVVTRTSNSVIVIDNTGLAAAAGTSYELFHWRHALPSDFGEFIGGLVFHREHYARPLVPVTDTEIRLRYQSEFREGDTTRYAVQAKEAGDASDWYLEFWPPGPAEAYFRGTYRATPADGLDDDDLTLEPAVEQVGPMHANTLLSAILAEVEAFYNDRPGVHTQRFQAQLAASIKHDLATAGPLFGVGGRATNPRAMSLFHHTPDYSDQTS